MNLIKWFNICRKQGHDFKFYIGNGRYEWSWCEVCGKESCIDRIIGKFKSKIELVPLWKFRR